MKANIPPFHVGQKVICVYNKDLSPSGIGIFIAPVKGKIYTVLAIRFCKCGAYHIAIGSDSGYTICLCGCVSDCNGYAWYRSTRFAPIQEQTAPLPEQIELTDEEVERINSEAKVFALGYIHPLKNNFETIYDLKRENLKLQLIISKLVTNKTT